MELLQVLLNSLIGIAVVFAVLIVLMGCVLLMSKFTKKPAAAPAPAAPTAPRAAKGSCGEVKIFDVPEKTAAMLMAITADKMNAPLNTLRFISIKEVK